MKYPQCQWCKEHVAPINIWANTFLAVVKGAIGILGNSTALIADSIHSFTDVLMAIVLYISLKISGRTPDKTHPYGYGHVEFIASGVIGLSLIFASIVIWYASIASIISSVLTEPEMIAVMALVLSIAINEFLFRYSICVGKQTKSPVIVANAWENRADGLTSFAALVGVSGARLGYPIFDPLAAIVVGVVIAYSAGRILSESVRGMMDTSIEPEKVDEIHSIASKVKGVKGINSLLTRKSGQKIWVDMEVAIDPETELKKAKSIDEEIKETVSKDIDNIGSTTVYMSPWRAEV